MKNLFALGIAAAALVVVPACGLVEAKAELEPLAVKVLVAVQEGRFEEVHRDASSAFRESASLEAFRAYAGLRRKALGAFRRVAKTTGVGLTKTGGAPTVGKISMDVEYERGPAQAELEFRKDGGTWRLGLLKIAFHENLLREPLARELLDLFDASDFEVLYARFSKPLQEAWPAAKYATEVRDLRARTGKALERTLRETREEGEGKVRLLFDVRFDSGPGEADLSLLWHEAAWHVMGFKLRMGPR